MRRIVMGTHTLIGNVSVRSTSNERAFELMQLFAFIDDLKGIVSGILTETTP
jgi:hypothetical protein